MSEVVTVGWKSNRQELTRHEVMLCFIRSSKSGVPHCRRSEARVKWSESEPQKEQREKGVQRTSISHSALNAPSSNPVGTVSTPPVRDWIDSELGWRGGSSGAALVAGEGAPSCPPLGELSR